MSQILDVSMGDIPTKPSVLLVADVPIRSNQSGGSVVLWRHQQRLKSMELVVPDAPVATPRPLLAKLLRLGHRLHLVRLIYVFRPLLQRYGMRLQPEKVAEVARRHRAILTVAHGLAWIDAMALARATGLPLVSIFHDWYPDASGCARGFTQLWDSAFRRLYRRSDLVFCVTEGMRRELGPHPNAQLLPPIPAALAGLAIPSRRPEQPFRIYYSGLAGGLYRPQLEALIAAVRRDSRFQLHISGSDSDTHGPLPSDSPVQLSGFLDGEAWQQAFAVADVLLVVLSFDQKHQRHLRTHFPSKLIEYVNRRKPIAVWGPATSSAAIWATGESHTLVVSNPDPTALLDALSSWLPGLEPVSPEARFDPKLIHHAFESALQQLLQGR